MPVKGRDTNKKTNTDREKMIEENIGLVHSCAHRLKGRGIEYDDLFQAGCMGLVKAYDAFDFDRGVRFSTYAVPVILGEMRRLFRDGGTVKVSRSIKERAVRVNRAREYLAVKLGREPTVTQISEYMGEKTEDVVEAISASSPVMSLTPSSDDDAPSAQIDLPVQSPEEELSDKLSLKQAVKALDERDKKLIQLRYFLGKTQTQTANELGMTQVQVSRREKKLLLILRDELCGK